MHTPLTEEQKQTGTRISHIEVKELLEDNRDPLGLRIIAGEEGLDRQIVERELHRPGLALAGFLQPFTFQRVQILGNTEIEYLRSLSDRRRASAVRQVMEHEIPCLILANDNEAPAEMLRHAKKRRIPLLTSPRNTTDLIHLLSDYLDDRFAPFISVHGSLVDVYGTGMLFTGRSGIGKSEIALDLVERGHRLVADDVVRVDKKAEGILMGTSPEMIRHFIEVRGVGMIDVRRMFGVRGIRLQKRIEVEVRLEEWDDNQEWERIGLDQDSTTYLGVTIPMVRLPIFPGKNITMIAEVVALSVHLRVYGFNPAEELNRRLRNEIDRQRVRRYLIRDYE
ncbi:MAG TPA: HPr(Ser) kinase/phosphatase [Bacteroidetes bacterium]|nr:HPr(Ser) kinase/phosphatase [Bacteroidota bacterium]